MSVKIMGLVWDTDLKPTLRFILLAYADHADHEGKSVFPSIKLVAKKTGFSSRTVQASTRELEQMGYLIPDGKGPKGTNRWKIPPYMGGESPAPPPDRVHLTTSEGESPAGGRVNLIAQRGAADAPEPLKNHHDKPSIKLKDSRPTNGRNEMIEAILEVCNLSWDTFRQNGKMKGLVNRTAKMLLERKLSVDDVHAYYGKNGWWWKTHWVGRDKRSPPRPEQIADTIDQAFSFDSDEHRRGFKDGWFDD